MLFRRGAASTSDTAKSGTGKEKGDPNRPLTWEDNWEKGEYPFVQLDSHRASCAICLLDFEEPKRAAVGGRGSDLAKATGQTQSENQTTDGPGAHHEGEGDVTEQMVTPTSPNSDLVLRLQDAGEGAQPLRLLKCGHVFHVSFCLPARLWC